MFAIPALAQNVLTNGDMSYREPGNFFVFDDRVDNPAQVFERRVRVRVRLQVGEDARVRVLFADFGDKVVLSSKSR